MYQNRESLYLIDVYPHFPDATSYCLIKAEKKNKLISTGLVEKIKISAKASTASASTLCETLKYLIVVAILL